MQKINISLGTENRGKAYLYPTVRSLTGLCVWAGSHGGSSPARSAGPVAGGGGRAGGAGPGCPASPGHHTRHARRQCSCVEVRAKFLFISVQASVSEAVLQIRDPLPF